MKPRLLIAIPNRHITQAILEMLSEIGWTWSSLKARQLTFETHDGDIHVFMVKTHDIPRMIVKGVFDLGFVQASVVQEESCPVNIVSTLPIAQGKIVVGVKKEAVFTSPKDLHGKCLITRNPSLAKLFLKQYQIECSIMEVSGSPEAYVCAGAGDAVLAYWKTGQTFHDNGLRILASVCKSQLQIITSNTNSDNEEITTLVGRIEDYLCESTIPERWQFA